MKKDKLNQLGKYVSLGDLEKLTNEERKELKKQCLAGRSCYVNDGWYDEELGCVGIFADCIISDDGVLF